MRYFVFSYIFPNINKNKTKQFTNKISGKIINAKCIKNKQRINKFKLKSFAH